VCSVSGMGEASAREAKEQKAIRLENSILVYGIEVKVIVIERMDDLSAS
jgi:hypothetical protein